MPTLDSLYIKDHLLYKDFTWNIRESSLVTIRGKNLDRSEDSGNATGKSTLPSSIATILYDAAPSAFKKKSSKEAMSSKSDMTLHVTNKRGQYSIRQYMAKTLAKLQVLHGKTDLTLKNKGDIRNEIAGIFPMPEDCFYSIVYLNQVRPPVLLTGKPLDRLKFFETVFDQTIYSDLKKLWSSKLTDISKKTSSYKTLKEELEGMTKVEAVSKNVLKSLRDEHKELLTKTQANQAIVNKLIAYVSIQEEVKNLLTSKAIDELIDDKKKKLAVLESEVRDYTVALEKNKAAKKASKEKKALEERLSSLPKGNLKALKAELKEASIKTSKIEALLERFEDWRDKLSEYNKLKKVLPNKKPQGNLKKLKRDLAKVEYIIDTLSELKPGEPCPTCHQKVDKTCIKDLKAAKQKQTAYSAGIELLESYERFITLKEDIPNVLFKTTEAITKEELKKAEKEEALLQEKVDTAQERKEILTKIESLPNSKIDKNYTEEGLNKKLKNRDKTSESINQLHNDLRLILKLESLHVDLPLDEAQKQLKSKQKWLDSTGKRLEEISEQLEDLMRKDAQYQITKDRIDSITEKMDSLKKDIYKKEIFEELKRACSHKGLMILETQELTKIYADKLNALSKDYFLEDVQFEINVDINKFDFIAHRSGQVGDIRYFSGSERGQFIPLSALALTSLIPTDARCNVMIMDELEGGMSVPEMAVFGNEFIPNVSRSIENTVIITPKPQEIFRVQGSREKLLVRKNKETRWEDQW